MSKEDFIRYANQRRAKREEAIKTGVREATSYAFETSSRINRRLACERKRRNYRW